VILGDLWILNRENLPGVVPEKFTSFDEEICGVGAGKGSQLTSESEIPRSKIHKFVSPKTGTISEGKDHLPTIGFHGIC